MVTSNNWVERVHTVVTVHRDHRDREPQRHRETQGHRDTETQSYRATETQRQRDREARNHWDGGLGWVMLCQSHMR